MCSFFSLFFSFSHFFFFFCIDVGGLVGEPKRGLEEEPKQELEEE